MTSSMASARSSTGGQHTAVRSSDTATARSRGRPRPTHDRPDKTWLGAEPEDLLGGRPIPSSGRPTADQMSSSPPSTVITWPVA